MICRRKGYPLKVVMPDNVTEERTQLLQMYGAEIVYSEGAKGSNGAVEVALEMAEADASYYMPYQYGNEANPRAHYDGTAVEILDELDEVTAFVGGLGTGGTLMGNGRRLKEDEPGDQDRRRRADAGRAGPGPALARRRLHPADHRPLPARPQDHGLQPRRDRLDAQAAARGGHLRRRLRRRDRRVAHRIAGELDGGNVVFLIPDDGWKYLSSRRLHQADRGDRGHRLHRLVVARLS